MADILQWNEYKIALCAWQCSQAVGLYTDISREHKEWIGKFISCNYVKHSGQTTSTASQQSCIMLHKWRHIDTNVTAVAQAVCRRSLTAETRVLSQTSPFGTCGGHHGTWPSYSPSTLVFPLRLFPLTHRNRILSICHWSHLTLANGSVVKWST
jgi:hypothetical protein